ncbi:unnamed protein product [Closterium sp. NIES-53]
MAAQELRWLTYLLADLEEPPHSPPVLYVDNKAMLALCREHRLEHTTKHIALRYFHARELQQRGQLRLAYVASEANIADIFTKALPPGDHQRFCRMLACFALLDWSYRGGEFSSDLLRDFCRDEGILQSFTLPASPQQHGIAERCICLVMEPRVSLPATSPTLRWTGKVGDASVFRDVTFDESVLFYRLFPYRSAQPRPPPLFLALGSPPVDPLPPQSPAPSGVSQVDPLLRTASIHVAVGSGAALGAASWGAASGGAEPEGVGYEGAGSRGAEPGGAEPEGVVLGGAES